MHILETFEAAATTGDRWICWPIEERLIEARVVFGNWVPRAPPILDAAPFAAAAAFCAPDLTARIEIPKLRNCPSARKGERCGGCLLSWPFLSCEEQLP